MIKNNKTALILSSAAILLPIPAGLFLWNRLPDSMATHWGADGIADGHSGKAFAVFALPLILFSLFWPSILITAKDQKNKGQNKKVLGMTLWILPILSNTVSGTIYAVALGAELRVSILLCILLASMFLFIGNYMPKCKQNHTIGIKIRWTLANEENWNATHRFAGRVWFFGGLSILFCAFLPESACLSVLPLLIAFFVGAPLVYSYVHYRKQRKEGKRLPPAPPSKFRKSALIVCIILIPALSAGLFLLLFTGDIALQYGDTAFTVRASYWGDLTVDYAGIDGIEYREHYSPGSRTNGFGSPRLSIGNFKNEEFGAYTLYSYTRCEACIVVTSNGKTLVLTGKDAAHTKSLYEDLSIRIQQEGTRS